MIQYTDPAIAAADALELADVRLDAALESANGTAVDSATLAQERADWSFALAVPVSPEGAIRKIRKALAWHSSEHAADDVWQKLVDALHYLEAGEPEAMGTLRSAYTLYSQRYDDARVATHLKTALRGLARPQLVAC